MHFPSEEVFGFGGGFRKYTGHAYMVFDSKAMGGLVSDEFGPSPGWVLAGETFPSNVPETRPTGATAEIPANYSYAA